jgi:hypothetical protein
MGQTIPVRLASRSMSDFPEAVKLRKPTSRPRCFSSS